MLIWASNKPSLLREPSAKFLPASLKPQPPNPWLLATKFSLLGRLALPGNPQILGMVMLLRPGTHGDTCSNSKAGCTTGTAISLSEMTNVVALRKIAALQKHCLI